MADVRSARTAVERIRKVVAAGTGQWTDTELLATLDEVLSSVWTQTNMAGRDHTLDSMEITVPDLVAVASVSGAYEWDPPAYVGPVRALEWLRAQSPESAVPIPTGALLMARGYLSNYPQQLAWHRSGADVVRISGLTATPRVRVWFLRRWPAMHFGTTGAIGTTTQMTLAPTAGVAPARPGWYVASRIVWNSGTNLDALVRVTSNTASPLVLNFTPILANAVAAGEQYSLLLPCDPEHADYVIQETALRLLSTRDGNSQQAREQRILVAKLEQAFVADLAERDMARQRRPSNSRTYR